MRITYLLISLLITSSAYAQEEIPLINHVDPFIGTLGDHGQLYPGATVPFGLVKLSPDTTGHGHSGYQYEAKKITGFSHTRVGGTGCNGSGGMLKLLPAMEINDGFSFDKKSEKASPGYYKVASKNGLCVELTVSEHVGFHRYTFKPNAKALVHVDPFHNYNGTVKAELQVIGDNMLTGMVQGRNVCNNDVGYTLYYAAVFNKPFTRPQKVDAKEGLWLTFPQLGDEYVLDVCVGISPIGMEQAKVEAQAALKVDFVTAKKQAESKWESVLGKYKLTKAVPQEMKDLETLFYTCIYRSHLLPHNVTSSVGTYRVAGDEKTLRKTKDTAQDYIHYSGWSTWDDFRKFALISMMEPDIAQNIARSIAEWFKGGNTPSFAPGYWPSPSVRNEFMSSILLDAYSKGLTDFDLAGTYKAGIPIHGQKEVEQPYSNYVKMRLAEALEKDDDAKMLREKALDYRSYWVRSQKDGEGTVRGFITPNGKPYPQDNVNKLDKGFYEGNLWHYRLFCNYDMKGLIALRGSREALVKDLQYYFEQWQHMALNEPPLAYPFLFAYLGRPDLTQKWSRMYTTEVVTSKYHNHGPFKNPVIRPVYQAKPDGFLPTMDDDTGAMSSQFVYQALGLYPAVMGDPYWVIGSPIFPEVTLMLKQDKKFVIRAKAVSSKNFYIESATLNGKTYDKPWIPHSKIITGGTLELIMGPNPSTWGSDVSNAPPSLTNGENITIQ